MIISSGLYSIANFNCNVTGEAINNCAVSCYEQVSLTFATVSGVKGMLMVQLDPKIKPWDCTCSSYFYQYESDPVEQYVYSTETFANYVYNVDKEPMFSDFYVSSDKIVRCDAKILKINSTTTTESPTVFPSVSTKSKKPSKSLSTQQTQIVTVVITDPPALTPTEAERETPILIGPTIIAKIPVQPSPQPTTDLYDLFKPEPLSNGAIAGIVVAGVGAIIGAVLLFVLSGKVNHKKRQDRLTPPTEPNMETTANSNNPNSKNFNYSNNPNSKNFNYSAIPEQPLTVTNFTTSERPPQTSVPYYPEQFYNNNAYHPSPQNSLTPPYSPPGMGQIPFNNNSYWKAIASYTPRLADELEIEEGDIVLVNQDGWATGINQRTGKNGQIALVCLLQLE